MALPSGFAAVSYAKRSATILNGPPGTTLMSVPNRLPPAPKRDRPAGLPSTPRPIVTYAPPRPWNDTSCGPVGCQVGSAYEGSPVTTRSCVPRQSLVSAPDGP